MARSEALCDRRGMTGPLSPRSKLYAFPRAPSGPSPALALARLYTYAAPVDPTLRLQTQLVTAEQFLAQCVERLRLDPADQELSRIIDRLIEETNSLRTRIKEHSRAAAGSVLDGEAESPRASG